MRWQLDCDAIVLEDEFTSGPITWMHAGRAVIFTTAADVAACNGDVLAALDKKMAEHPEAKALLLSSVSYMDGHALDMERAGSLCRARGVDLVVDAAQSLGALPIDVRAAHVSFLCAPSYKWLCSGPGLGVLFVSQGDPGSFTRFRPYLAHFPPVFSRFLRVFTVSLRFQRATSREE